MKSLRPLFVSFSLCAALSACKPQPANPTGSSKGAASQSSSSQDPAPKKSGEQKAVPDAPSFFAPRDRSKCGLPNDIREADWPRTLPLTEPDEPPLPEEGTFTVAVLPDTQYYASCNELHFPEQGRWLAAQIERRNLVAAIQLGDLTEHNSPEEWEYVSRSLSPLFDTLPLFLATGNHDYGTLGKSDVRKTLFPDYFGAPKKGTKPHVAEMMEPDSVENAYYRVPLAGFTLGVLVLEWSPRTKTVKWARQAALKYPKDRKIFVTHAYMYYDDTRYDFNKKGEEQSWNPLSYGTARVNKDEPYSEENRAPEGAYDGEMLWQELLIDMPGLFLTLNGHVLGDGTGLLTSQSKSGGLVHQVLVNYQMLDEGGLGYLRLLTFNKAGTELRMVTYSPSLNRSAVAADQRFVLQLVPPLR